MDCFQQMITKPELASSKGRGLYISRLADLHGSLNSASIFGHSGSIFMVRYILPINIKGTKH